MNLTKILTYVFFLVAIGLAYFLFNSIKFEIDNKERISIVEEDVIQRLEMIRDAQNAYLKVNNQYTGDWKKLLSFIDTGKIYIVQKREEVVKLAYGADSSIFHIDTLGFVDVMDSLFSRHKYPDFDLEELPLIPEGGGKKFEMFADKITKGNVEVDIVEVKDIAPFDKSRTEDSDARNRKPLRFGSRTDITIGGNWE
jgi:hypothetical protein